MSSVIKVGIYFYRYYYNTDRPIYDINSGEHISRRGILDYRSVFLKILGELMVRTTDMEKNPLADVYSISFFRFRADKLCLDCLLLLLKDEKYSP